MKTFGTIIIIIAVILMIYSFFVPTSINEGDVADKKIEALRNRNIEIWAVLFFVVGILARQGLWELK